jgi:hypothetical protein
MPSKSSVPITARIPNHDVDALRRIAAREHVTVSRLISVIVGITLDELPSVRGGARVKAAARG